MALNPIRKKIEALKYDSMEDFELDLKQLIDNARLYNSSDSLVFANAEQMQKVAYQSMGKQYFGQEPAAEDFFWMEFKVRCHSGLRLRVSVISSLLCNVG